MTSKPFFDQIKNTSLRKALLRAIRNEWTHDSTAIEGNSLTLGETDFVLSEGLTVSGKPLSHHQEIYGHAKAIEIIYQMLNKQHLDEQDLFHLHQAVLNERVADIYYPVGRWKIEPNFTYYVRDNKRAQHEYPHPEVIPTLMSQWLKGVNQWIDHIASRKDAVQSYAELHMKFVAIHPFVDGNGRMARLLANIPLLMKGFPPINIPSEDRVTYLQVISTNNSVCDNVGLEQNLDHIVDPQTTHQFGMLCEKWWYPILELVDRTTEKDIELQKNILI